MDCKLNRYTATGHGHVEAMMTPDFSVDEYLSKNAKIVNLETLMSELEGYLEILKSTKLELINTDYEQYIILSSKLSDLSEKINNIQNPLCKMKENIIITKDVLNVALERISSLLNSRKTLYNRKQRIRSTEYIQMSLDKLNKLIIRMANEQSDTTFTIMLLERVVNEKIRCNFHLQKCDYNISSQHINDYECINEIIMNQLNNVFLSSYHSKNKNNISTCLYLYETLKGISHARYVVRREITLPEIKKFINEDYLKNQPLELEGVYSKIILFIDQQIKQLLDVANSSVRGVSFSHFNFMVHSIWPEIEHLLGTKLKCIFLSSNPDIFHKRYTATLKFLDQFEQRCITAEIVKEFRSLQSYNTFMLCWNLPIYFQLRFQDIAASVEKVLTYEGDRKLSTDNEWKLLATQEVWIALETCWSENILIKHLAHRFWKLNLQILSRYSIWIKDTIQLKNKNTQFKSKIPFLFDAYSDGNHLIEKSTTILLSKVQQLMENVSPKIIEKLENSLKESLSRIKCEIEAIAQCVTDSIVEDNVSVVRQVNDIPRLFRRTNRDNPTQPCSYVSALLSNVIDIKNNHGIFVSKWLPQILSAVTEQYYEHISKVLTSVQRTEESLRRFKKIRDPSANESKVNTDDDKIRLQIQLDIQNYVNMVEYILETQDRIEKLEELKTISKSLKTNL